MKTILASAIVSLLLATAATRAAVPKSLHGSWVVDKEATTRSMKSSPDWNEEDAKMLPMILGMMSKMCLTFDASTMAHAMGSRKKVLKAQLVSSKGGQHTLRCTQEGEKDVVITARIDKLGLLYLKAKDDNDLDHVVWKKGKPSATADQDVAAAMAQAFTSALQEGLKDAFSTNASPTPPDASGNKQEPQEEPAGPDFKEDWGQFKIRRLSKASVDAINKQANEKVMPLFIENSCSQESFDKTAAFPWVKKLELGYGNKNITSFAPVANMPALEEFKSASTGDRRNGLPFDLTPFAKLKEVTELDFYATAVTNTIALKNLTKLKKISFYMSNVASLDFLAGTPDLEELTLYGFGHTFKDYTPLRGLKKLKELDVYMNTQATDENLAALSALTALEDISMSNCKKFTSFAFLKNAMGLKEVNASWCSKLSDISALADKKGLTEIDIDDSAVSDFTALAGKTELRDLNVSGTSFSDLSVIKASTQLRSLNIGETQVKDISPLAQFKDLSRVTIPKDIPESQASRLKEMLPKLRIDQK